MSSSRSNEGYPLGDSTAQSSAPSDVSTLSGEVMAAIDGWTKSEGDQLPSLLRRVLDEVDTRHHLSTIPLSFIVSSTIASLDVDSLVKLYATVFNGIAEDVDGTSKTDTFAEVLVDVVESANQGLAERVKSDPSWTPSEEGSTGEKGILLLQSLLTSGHLPQHIANLGLGSEILYALRMLPGGHGGQARSVQIANALYTRKTTALTIKQTKYNLLRESSEGFAGVIVLLLSDEVLAPFAREETEYAVSQRAARVWNKLLGLTGQFDLAPPRILDLILEVAGSQVALHYRFFLELIRCTPWGSTGESISRKGKGKAVHPDWKQEEAQRIQDALDAGGDETLAKVLGNKLRAYREEDTPMGLIYFTALLLKFKFVGLQDLLPFLSPNDDGMAKLRKDWLASLDPRRTNALAMASALVDEDAPDSKPGEDTKDTLKDTAEKQVSEQIPMLVQALLSIGAISLAQSFLARFPWLAQSHPAITDVILLIVSRALEPVYQATHSLDAIDEDFDWNASPVASNNDIPHTSLWNPPPLSTPLNSFAFFYPDWDEDLEEWQSVDDIFEKGQRWLGLVRGAAARRIDICVKLCRLATTYFALLQGEKEAMHPVEGVRNSTQLRAIQPTDDEISRWLPIIRQVLLPALSCSTSIAPFGAELWPLIHHLPYNVRFALYGDWRETCNPKSRDTDPLASKAAKEATEQTKHVLRRIVAKDDSAKSTDAEKATARSLANASFSNPLSVLDRALQQVKTYSNLGEYIVEACRYLEPLAQDVAVFSILDMLSTPGLAAPQGALNDPLTNVANFLGEYARRYIVDLEPVFRFILNRLSASNPTELVVLDRLVVVMAGLTPMEDNAVSNDQLKAFSGGVELVREAISATTLEVQKPLDPSEQNGVAKQVKLKKPKLVKNSLPRLLAYCRDPEYGLPIWISLAQTYRDVMHRPSLVDTEADDDVKWDKWTAGEQPKTMSERLDSIHASFGQFGDLIAENLTADQLVEMTPNLTTLVHRDDLGFSPAFCILRPKLQSIIAKQRLDEDSKRREEKKVLMRERLEKERSGELAPAKDAASPAESATPTLGDDGDIAMESEPKEPFLPSAKAVMDESDHLLPEGVRDLLRSPFFVTFWQLTLADIDHSAESYNKAIKRISQLEKDVSAWRVRVMQGGHYVQKELPESRHEVARLAARRKELDAERVKQRARKEQTVERLEKESKHWFAPRTLGNDHAKQLAHQVLEWCLFPRACLSPSDAIYTAKFVMLTHRFATPGFSTLYVYQHLFDRGLSSCVYTRTLTEARNYGRCLAAMLEVLHNWHANEKLYNAEAVGVSADGTVRPGLEVPLKNKEGVLGLNPLGWRQFRNLYAKIQLLINGALTACLSADDFMHVQNAITVGLQIVKFFPIMKPHGEAVMAAVQAVSDGKTGPGTPDVQFQAQGYLRTITLARRNPKDKKVSWVQPADFHTNRIVVNAEAPKERKPAIAPAADNAEPAKPPQEAKPEAVASTPAADLKARLQRERAAGALKEDVKPAEEIARPSTPAAVPVGPRADRGTPVAPTGPSANRASPAQASPARQPDTSMAPPNQTIEEARKAERARRFASSSTVADARSRTSTPTPAAQTEVKAEVKAERRPSPAPSTRSHTSARPTTPPLEDEKKDRRARSRSAESRMSERSKRDRRDREDDRRDLRPANGTRSRAESVARSEDRPRHLDAPKTRDGPLSRDGEDSRRSSRDTGRRDREEDDRRERRGARRERDKDERKEKDDRRDDRSRRDDRTRRDDRDRRDDGKRKRDDDRRDDRRESRDDRSERDARDRHDSRRPRERDVRGARDSRDPPDRDARHRRDSERDVRASRDGPRDGPRDLPLADPARPDRRELMPSSEARGPAAGSAESRLPPRPVDSRNGDRIVEAPRSTRGGEHRGTTNGNGLPTRPRSPIRESARPRRPPTPPLDLPSPSSSNLLSRLAPSNGASTPPAHARDDRAESETRKRQRDDDKPAAEREPLADGEKKRRIVRTQARRDDGPSRMLSSAMTSAQGKK